MNAKKTDQRFLTSVVLSLLVAVGTLFVARKASFYAYELGIETANSSEQVTTTVWGAPFHFFVDKPSGESVGAIDGGDIFSGSAFLADWLAWFVLMWLLSYFVPTFFEFLFRFAREFIKPTA